MKYILTSESFFKKIGNWINMQNKKSSEITIPEYFDDIEEEVKKDVTDYHQRFYSCDKNNPKKIEHERECNHFGDMLSLDIRALDWIEKNPGKFLISNLKNYNLDFSRFKLIKLNILIKDLLEVCNGKLDIICIRIVRYPEDEKFKVIVFLREIGHEEGDGMPVDIYDNYVESIRYKLKKKANRYLKGYFLREDYGRSLYDVTAEEQSERDSEFGIISISVNPLIGKFSSINRNP